MPSTSTLKSRAPDLTYKCWTKVKILQLTSAVAYLSGESAAQKKNIYKINYSDECYKTFIHYQLSQLNKPDCSPLAGFSA